jgi:hypothetical protein
MDLILAGTVARPTEAFRKDEDVNFVIRNSWFDIRHSNFEISNILDSYMIDLRVYLSEYLSC